MRGVAWREEKKMREMHKKAGHQDMVNLQNKNQYGLERKTPLRDNASDGANHCVHEPQLSRKLNQIVKQRDQNTTPNE